MKKITALFFIIVFAFTLVACKHEAIPEIKEIVEIEEVTEDISENDFVYMANPWEEVDNDFIVSKIGTGFNVPLNSYDVTFRWNETIKMAEMLFTFNDASWIARISKTDKFNDITGMYYIWPEDNLGFEKTNNIFGIEGEQYYYLDDNETAAAALWFNDKENIMYSLSYRADSDSLFYILQGGTTNFDIAKEIFTN